MRRRILIVLAILLTLFVVLVVLFRVKHAQFTLDPEYYGISDIQTIDAATLNQLISDQKSFGLFVSQPSCQASTDLAKYLNAFTDTYQIKFYEISFSTLRDHNIVPDLRFYPSFVLFRDGEVVDFLEADSDEDTPAYTSADGFVAWFSEYIKLYP